MVRTYLASLAGIVWLLACGTGEKAEAVERTPVPTQSAEPTMAKAWVVLDAKDEQKRVQVEVAKSHEERSRGLMFRKELADGSGMLFIFERERDQTFWMKNTYIPLDMIFIRGDMTIAGIVHEATPLTLTQRSVGLPSLYVLEVPGGWAKSHGIEAEQRVRFEGLN